MLCRSFTYHVQSTKYRHTKLSPSFWITLYLRCTTWTNIFGWAYMGKGGRMVTLVIMLDTYHIGILSVIKHCMVGAYRYNKFYFINRTLSQFVLWNSQWENCAPYNHARSWKCSVQIYPRKLRNVKMGYIIWKVILYSHRPTLTLSLVQ